MATVSKGASSNTAVTTGWTSPTNAQSLTGDNVYATAAPAKSSTINSDFGFAFSLADFTGAAAAANVAIDSIVVTAEWKLSNATVGGTLGLQLRNQNTGTLLGTETTDTTSTADTQKTQTITSGITAAELIAGNLAARIRDSRLTSNTAHTGSLDFVKVDVTYHLVDVIAPSAINATSSMSGTVANLAGPGVPQGNALYAVPVAPDTFKPRASRLLGPLTTASSGSTKAVVPAAINATSTLSGNVVRLRPLGASITASSAMAGSVVRLRPLAPAAINATSSFSATLSKLGSVVANGTTFYATPRDETPETTFASRLVGPLTETGTGAIVPAGINATSSMTGAVVRLRPVAPAAVNATSTVSGNVVRLRRVTTAAINASSTVTGTVNAIHRVVPAAVNATSTLTGNVVRLRPVTPSSVNATSTLTGTVSKLGTKAVVPSAINATSTLSAVLNAKHAVTPAAILSTSSLSGSLAVKRMLSGINITATSTVGGSLARTNANAVYVAKSIGSGIARGIDRTRSK